MAAQAAEIRVRKGSDRYKVLDELFKEVQSHPHGLVIDVEGHPKMRLCNEEDIDALRDLLSGIKEEFTENQRELAGGKFNVFDKETFLKTFKPK